MMRETLESTSNMKKKNHVNGLASWNVSKFLKKSLISVFWWQKRSRMGLCNYVCDKQYTE